MEVHIWILYYKVNEQNFTYISIFIKKRRKINNIVFIKLTKLFGKYSSCSQVTADIYIAELKC